MIDWMHDNAWVTWLGVAALFGIAELLTLDLVLLMFGIGALAAVVSAALGVPFWLCLAVFVVVSLGLLVFARPPMLIRLHAGPTLTTGHATLVGRIALVVEPVDVRDGRIQLAGELWSARLQNDAPRLEIGTEVLVTRIDGATAIVTTKES